MTVIKTMELARRIKTIRMARGKSQQDMADFIGISQPTYSSFERKAGNCSYYTLLKIAEALEVSLPFLLDVKNNNFIENIQR